MIQQIDPKLIAAGVAFLIALADGIRRYRDDDKIKLSQLPLVELRALLRFVRRKFFTIDKPNHASIVVDHSVESLTRELGKQGVKPGHSFSYRYDGEVYNAIMYYFDPDRELPHRQIHVRAFPHTDGLELLCHEEPHWFHHPVAHVKSNDMQFEPANRWVQERLYEQVPVGYPGN